MPFYNHETHYAQLVVSQRPAGAAAALDVGCGDGRYTVLLAQAGIDNVAGLDAEPSIPAEIETQGL